MGTWTTLEVDGYELWSTKSDVDPEAMTIFRESDRRELKDPSDDDDEQEPRIVYRCVAQQARQRLDIMGFTMKRVRSEFEHLRQAELMDCEAQAADGEDSKWFVESWNTLKMLTFDEFCQGLQTVIDRKLYQYSEERDQYGPVIKYILDEHYDLPFGFFSEDIRCLIRVACELVQPTAEVAQDVSGLVYGGYYARADRICARAIQDLIGRYPENAPRIILTEGSSDGWILKDALELLHPHLAEYYSFLDFQGSGSQGGAPHLIRMVQAFAGAGVTNRIIALLDNDTAATDAMRALKAMPPNIAVRQYPDLEDLRAYPTLGPAGASNLDINGLAASIELYLGADVLAACDHPPIQWRGYVESLRRYQGEVLQKSRIHAEYQRKVKACRGDPSIIEDHDWTGLRAILQSVFTAFG